jgi:hypothetical protein
MKKLILINFILLSILCKSQLDTTINYPLQKANYWEYQDKSIPYGGRYYYDKVIKDTLMPNGKNYWQIERKFFDEISAFYRYERKEDNRVYTFYNDSIHCTSKEFVIYDFKIKDSVIWPVCRYIGNNRQFHKGLSKTNYQTYFSMILECKTFHDIIVENGDTIWNPLGNYEWPRTIAKGIGKVAQVIEHIGWFILQGTIIDGKKYGTIVGINEETNQENLSSLSIYPNPTNSSAQILFSLKEYESIELSIYNIVGQRVLTLIDDNKVAGNHNYNLNTSLLTSGVYFIKLKTKEKIYLKKLILIK